MNIYSVQSFYKPGFILLRESTIDALTAQQKKIITIVFLALSFITAAILYYKYCFKAHKKDLDNEDQKITANVLPIIENKAEDTDKKAPLEEEATTEKEPVIDAKDKTNRKPPAEDKKITDTNKHALVKEKKTNLKSPVEDRKTVEDKKTEENDLDEPSPVDQGSFLLSQYIDEMERTMGGHLHDYQQTTLMNLFPLAMQDPLPKKTMEKLIDQKINQPDGWGADKALHIKKNLLPLFPLGVHPGNTKNKVQEIADTPINAQGDCLVCFYKSGPTEFLGNFAPCASGIRIWGQTFQCAEAAFQWKKFSMAAQQNHRIDMQQDPNMLKFFTCDGEEAFRLRKYFDHQYPQVYVSGWQKGVRDQTMWEILQAKFSQNQAFHRLLQDTAGAYLLEHNQAKRDDYWSDNHDGSGKNMLGKMLMALRDNKPCPIPNDAADAEMIRKFANYANQPGALNYPIF